MLRNLRRVGGLLARWLLASVWIILPLLPVLGLVLSHLLGADAF